MISDLLKTFIIASSWIVFAPFFHTFYNYKSQYNPDNCIQEILGLDPYYFYTLATPLYFGVMSMLGVLLSQQFNLDLHAAFLIVALLSTTAISIAITKCKVYTFSPERLQQQYLGLLKYHTLFYVVVIASLVKWFLQ
jgi:hypothetical protein